MDVYEPDPSVDTEGDRPMVLVVHGGDALPRLANNACYGDKADSVTVTTARKLARMGYVAVAPNYRLGWNPLATTQDAFLDGLVDASVRIQQDLRACARYLRRDIEEEGNTYNINSNKFGIWGTASSAGTYSGFAAYINELEELQSPTFFVTDDQGNVFNTFNEMEAGNIQGTVTGLNALGDTTNYVNTPDYSDAFQIAALGSGISLDPGIVDADEPPMIQFGNPASVVTQFEEGPIQLPTTGEGLIKEANEVGVNDAWSSFAFTDGYSEYAANDPNFGDVEGWLPMYGHPDNEYPWVHWDEVNCPVSDATFDVLPEASRDLAIGQIDTMAGYFGVRACISLGLDCPSVTSTREVLLDKNVFELSPNPTDNLLHLKANFGRTMEAVEIYSFDGQMVRQFEVENTVFQENNLNLAPGFYSVLVRFEDGIASKKLVINR